MKASLFIAFGHLFIAIGRSSALGTTFALLTPFRMPPNEFGDQLTGETVSLDVPMSVDRPVQTLPGSTGLLAEKWLEQ